MNKNVEKGLSTLIALPIIPVAVPLTFIGLGIHHITLKLMESFGEKYKCQFEFYKDTIDMVNSFSEKNFPKSGELQAYVQYQALYRNHCYTNGRFGETTMKVIKYNIPVSAIEIFIGSIWKTCKYRNKKLLQLRLNRTLLHEYRHYLQSKENTDYDKNYVNCANNGVDYQIYKNQDIEKDADSYAYRESIKIIIRSIVERMINIK